ncbi:hypothetical protein C6370_00070 [Bacillus atrophaeus]|uniref:hypothetical protein n=1 Tax=Bacillus atrophaeus TaxID=1452 RepID=UPI000D0691D4|nr:hypothetical protein [Bacillus atrophaeus]PSA95818.1 hypothetical protein C6370_00070 [Bacillus atrophaeus]WNV77946.1 hypothetical protein RUL31_10740 [Bacillus atrophaeus]
MGQKVVGTTEVLEFMFMAEDLLQRLVPIKYSKAILSISDSPTAMENLSSIKDIVESCREVRATIDKNNVIEIV